MNFVDSTSPVRVLQVVSRLDVGGIEAWLLQVSQAINRSRFQIDLLVHTDSECAYDAEMDALGCRILRVPHHRRPWTCARNFRRLVREYGPYDVIHSNVFRLSGYYMLLAHAAGIPVRIAHSHNTTVDGCRLTIYRRVYNFLMSSWLARYPTHLLAVSRDAALGLFGPGSLNDPRLHLVPSAIDLTPFRENCSRQEVRPELSLPLDAKVVGHVGRFAAAKNQDFFIEVASILCQRRPELQFLLVGEGPSRAVCMAKVEKLGLAPRFKFTGTRRDVARLMLGAMDLFLFPSKWEGFPRVVLKAQAAGLPCLIADAVTEEVEVVQPLVQRLSLKQPPAVWAEAVLAALDNPPAVSPEAALSAMECSRFSIADNVKVLESLYLQALSERKIKEPCP